MTLGPFINGKNLKASTDDWTFMHEYGHTLQSRYNGPFYGLFIAPPSGLDVWLGSGQQPWSENSRFLNHEVRWYETAANRRASRYFKKYNVTWKNSENPTHKSIARNMPYR